MEKAVPHTKHRRCRQFALPIEARSIRVRRYADGYRRALIQTLTPKQNSKAKVYEPQIDPEEFIRTFRDDPSGLSSIKRKSTEKKSEDTPSDDKTQPTVNKAETPKTAPADKITSAAPTDGEREYRQKYIANLAYLRPKERFLMVEIHPDHIQKIKRIISYENESPCSIKSYINNVLAEHFERYEAIIKKRL